MRFQKTFVKRCERFFKLSVYIFIVVDVYIHIYIYMTKNNAFRKTIDLSEKRHVEHLKMFRTEKHKWYLGVPIHIKLIFSIVNILFISIMIHKYILLYKTVSLINN